MGESNAKKQSEMLVFPKDTNPSLLNFLNNYGLIFIWVSTLYSETNKTTMLWLSGEPLISSTEMSSESKEEFSKELTENNVNTNVNKKNNKKEKKEDKKDNKKKKKEDKIETKLDKKIPKKNIKLF